MCRRRDARDLFYNAAHRVKVNHVRRRCLDGSVGTRDRQTGKDSKRRENLRDTRRCCLSWTNHDACDPDKRDGTEQWRSNGCEEVQAICTQMTEQTFRERRREEKRVEIHVRRINALKVDLRTDRDRRARDEERRGNPTRKTSTRGRSEQEQPPKQRAFHERSEVAADVLAAEIEQPASTNGHVYGKDEHGWCEQNCPRKTLPQTRKISKALQFRTGTRGCSRFGVRCASVERVVCRRHA